MGWSVSVMPVHVIAAAEGGWDFLLEVAAGERPDGPPPRSPLPTGLQVYDALRRAGCWGHLGTRLQGHDDAGLLAPQTPESPPELYLGTVWLGAGVELDDQDDMPPAGPVKDLHLWKPSQEGVLTVSCALVPLFGEVMIIEPGGGDHLLVRHADTPAGLAARHPRWG